MNCSEARRMITAYVKKELPDKEMEQFLHHIGYCSDCMDELDTYYTVYQALDLLDDGGTHDFNFRRMLKHDIRESQRRLTRRKAAGVLCGVLLFLTEILLAVSVYTGYEIEKGAAEYTVIQRAMLRITMQGSHASEAGTGNPDEPKLEIFEMPTETE